MAPVNRFTLHGLCTRPLDARMGITRPIPLRARTLDRHCAFAVSAWAGRAMDEQETGYDYVRYKQLLAEAVDETRRLELIEIMIRENARDRLEAQRPRTGSR